MMDSKFDVIIPVAGKDAGFVHRVTKYIRKNLVGVDIIYLITSKSNFNKIGKSIKGQYDIKIIDENTLVDGLTIDNIKAVMKKHTTCTSPGWYYQQFLKYGFGMSKYAKDYYLSWDADTIPVSKISFFEDGHPLFTKKYEYNDNYFVTMKNILGIDKIVPFSFIAEHMMFSSQIVKELTNAILESNVPGDNWMEKILMIGNYNHKLPAFSEFETYGTFVMTRYPDIYRTRQLNTFRRGGWIMGRYISDKKLNALSFDTDTISFEMKDEPLFPYNIPNKWWRIMDLFKKGISNKPHIVIRKIGRLIKS